MRYPRLVAPFGLTVLGALWLAVVDGASLFFASLLALGFVWLVLRGARAHFLNEGGEANKAGFQNVADRFDGGGGV